MGLLDNLFNSEDGRMGLGLLAAGSARGDGAGFGQRLSEAVGSVDQWKQQQAQAKRAKMMEEMQMMQMEQAKAQAQDAATRRSIFSQNFQQAIPASADGMGPTRAMGFDHNNAAIQMGQAGMGEQAMDLMSRYAPKPADYKVVGNSLLQVGNDGVKPVYSEPEKPKEVDPNKPFMMVDGKIVPNEAYQAFDLRSKSAGAPKMSVDLRDPTAVANAGMKLQDAYRAATKPSYARAQAYEAMTEASKNPSAKGDLTMVYSFVKALDPESVVREGEISLLNANRSVPDSIKGYAQRLATGQSLLPKEREDLLNQARTLTQTDYKPKRYQSLSGKRHALRVRPRTVHARPLRHI
jgi:hypothetical protein